MKLFDPPKIPGTEIDRLSEEDITFNVSAMKNLLFVILCLSIPGFISAQETVDTYCMIVGTNVSLKKKVTVQVDFGEGIKI